MKNPWEENEDELTTDYENRCGNCHNWLGEKDKYCSKCGTKRGEGIFLPYRNIVYCVYGPPVTQKFKCSECGFAWTIGSLGGRSDIHYCPQCGKHQVTMTESIKGW